MVAATAPARMRSVLQALITICSNIPVGVLLYGTVGVLGIVYGGAFLEFNVLDHHSTVHGQHRGIFWIELGVGITVASVMVAIFYLFAGRVRRDQK